MAEIAIAAAISVGVGLVTSALAPKPKLLPVDKGRYDDIRIQSSEFGTTVPIVYGRARIAGNIIWSDGVQPYVTTTPGRSGGKGGGGNRDPEPPTNHYSYTTNLAVALCEGEVFGGLKRVWEDTKMVVNYDIHPDVIEVGTVYEAELSGNNLTSGAVISQDPAASGGSKVMLDGVNASVKFNNIVASSTATHTIIIFYSANATYQCLVKVNNGVSRTFLFENTGSFNTFGQITVTADLVSGGSNTFEILRNSSEAAPHIDSIRVMQANAVIPSVTFTNGISGGVNPDLGNSLNLDDTRYLYNAQPELADPGDGGGGGGGGFNEAVITSVSPQVPVSSGSPQSINVGGSLFQAGLTVTLTNPSSVATTISGGNIQNVTANYFTMVATLNAVGLWTIRVNNPDSSISNTFLISVQSSGGGGSTPVITSISPQSPIVSPSPQNVRVFGTGFEAGLTVDITWPVYGGGGTTISGGVITNVTATSFVMNVTLGLLGGGGTWTIRVNNPTTGSSNVFPFFVQNRSTTIGAGGISNIMFYPGSETQLQDPTMIGIDGVLSTPAYRGICYVVIADYSIAEGRIPNFTFEVEEGTHDLADIITSLYARVGLDSQYLNLDAIKGTYVQGLVINSRGELGEILNSLQLAYNFDLIDADAKIKAVKRTGVSILTIPEAKLKAHDAGSEVPPASTEIEYADESQLPRQIDVSYMDLNLDYHQNIQPAQKQIGYTADPQTLVLPLVLTSTEAKQIGLRLLHSAHLQKSVHQLTLMPENLSLMPTDVITVTLANATHKLRIIQMQAGLPGVVKITAVPDSVSVYNQTLIGPDMGGYEPPIVTSPANSKLVLMDVPPVFVEHTGLGFYAAACGRGNGDWRGAHLYKEEFPNIYNRIAGFDVACTIGVLDGQLSTAPTYDGDNLDATSDFYINLYYGSLESFTVSEILTSTANLAYIGGELVQFVNATSVATTAPFVARYHVTLIKRGVNGTLSKIPIHGAGEDFVLFNSAVQYLRENVENAYLFANYKCVTLGQQIANVAITNFGMAGGSAPPDVLNVTTSEGHFVTANQTWISTILGEFDFGEYVGEQIARIYVKFETDGDYRLVDTIIPDSNNHGVFEILGAPLTIGAGHLVKIVTESRLGLTTGIGSADIYFVDIVGPPALTAPDPFMAYFDLVDGDCLQEWSGQVAGPTLTREVYQLQQLADDGTTVIRDQIIDPILNKNLSDSVIWKVVADSSRQAEIADVIGTITGTGTVAVIVTAAGMTNSPKTVQVPVINGDENYEVAGKIQAFLKLDSDISAFLNFPVHESGFGDPEFIHGIFFEKKTPEANDPTFNMAIANGTCTGLTAAPTSATLGFTRLGHDPMWSFLPEGGIDFDWDAGVTENALIKFESVTTAVIGDGLLFEFQIPENGRWAPFSVTLFPTDEFYLGLQLPIHNPVYDFHWYCVVNPGVSPSLPFYMWPEGFSNDDLPWRRPVQSGDRMGIYLRPDGIGEYHVNFLGPTSRPVRTSGKKVKVNSSYGVMLTFTQGGVGGNDTLFGIRKPCWVRVQPDFKYNAAAQRIDRELAFDATLPTVIKARVRQKTPYLNGSDSPWTSGVFTRP